MDFGTTIPMRGPLAHAEAIRALAHETEAMGFSHISVTDHLIVPRRINSDYPYTDDGKFPGEAEGFAFEQFSVMSYLAALTSKAKLITAITVVLARLSMPSFPYSNGTGGESDRVESIAGRRR